MDLLTPHLQDCSAMLANTPEAALLLSVERHILAASAPAAGLFGYSSDEMAGMPFSVLIPQPEPYHGLVQREGITQSGKALLLELSYTPLDDQVILVFLRPRFSLDDQSFFRTLVRNVPRLGLLVADPTLRFVFAEGEILRENGYTDIEGRSLGEVVPAATAAQLEPLYRRALAGEEFSIEHQRLGKVFRILFLPIRDQKRGVVGVMAITNDVTEQRQLEGRLTEANEALEARIAERTDALQNAHQDMQRFAYSTAHNLKNPLALLVSTADFLLQEKLELSLDEQAKALSLIENTARKMANIVNEMLLLAEVQHLEEMTFAPVDMVMVIHEALNRLRHTTDLDIRISPVLPSVVSYAPWLEEVWANYLSNALRYGGNPPKIQIGASEDEKMITYWVQDNGAGIAPEEHEKLFADFTHLPHTQGHGLGLAIVKRIVNKLGGEVGVESTLGLGSRFWFSLPKR